MKMRSLQALSTTIFIFLFGLTPLSLWAQTVQTFNTSGSFTVPCGVTSITVQCWGAGGGGAGDVSGGVYGSGGGGGGYSAANIAVVPGTVIAYTVGTGGAGGAGNSNGAAGGSTTFSTVIAGGGGGGTVNGGVGGVGGVGTVQNGTNGSISTIFLSGAGGNAGGGGGTGGAAQSGNANGNPGNPPGGGGSGGRFTSGSNKNGGAGANGRITLTYNGPNAGPDQWLSCTNSTVMAANLPSVGTGTWSVVSGTATITTPNSPNTTITGLVFNTVVVLRWTWTGAGCPAVSDDVTLNVGICADEPCSAQPIAVNTSCSYSTFSNTNSTASNSFGQPGCGMYTGNDMWYSAVVPANGTLTIQAVDNAGGTNIYPGIAIYTGPDCSTLTHHGCASTASTVTPATSTYVGTPGETVWIRLWDINGAEGVYNICAFTHTNSTGDVFAGTTTTLSCPGPAMTFTDPGGSGNYSNNLSATWTVCPPAPGQYVTVTFSSFSLENNFDFLTVIDGAGSNDPIIGNYTGATLPPTITSSDADGCLTFFFRSDNINVAAGWNATVSCSSTPGTNTNFCSTTNCSGNCGTWICADGLFPTNNSGSVGVQELGEQVAGCLGGAGEVATAWFYFTALSAGNIQFTFDGPNGQDYDFAVWGPSASGDPPCPMNTGLSPIRCSFADVQNTANPVGLMNGAGDFYEGPEGDGFVEDLDVLPGETYALVLNIYMNGNPQPVIDLDISGTGTLDCTPLPIELLSFDGIYDNGFNRVRWQSATEYNNNYYTLYYSNDAVNWEVLNSQPGAGNSNVPVGYSHSHVSPYSITYYKLRQTDYDGKYKEFGPISISKMGSGDDFVFNFYPNPSDNVINVYTAYDGNLTIKLVDNLGRIVKAEVIPGGGLSMLDVSSLQAGIYILQVESDKGIERQERIIIK